MTDENKTDTKKDTAKKDSKPKAEERILLLEKHIELLEHKIAVIGSQVGLPKVRLDSAVKERIAKQAERKEFIESKS